MTPWNLQPAARQGFRTLKTAVRPALLSCLLLSTGMGGPRSPSSAEAALGTCGNGITEKFEQCDDGKLQNGDGCSSLCQKEGDEFPVKLYTAGDPPPTPALEELPLLDRITHHGITWTFASPQRVGRFVNGDYYVVGEAAIIDIQPLPTPTNGRHGSMVNVQPSIQRSGFDSRIQAGRYDPRLRVYPPLALPPES